MRQEWIDRWGPDATPLLWSHAMIIRLAVELAAEQTHDAHDDTDDESNEGTAR